MLWNLWTAELEANATSVSVTSSPLILPKDPENPVPREPVPKKTKGRPSNSITTMPPGPD